MVVGATGHQRLHSDGFIYIRYAASPYSAHISAIYLLPFGLVPFADLNVQRLKTKQNAECMEGAPKRRSYFYPLVDQSS